jgi:hypothetical protein
MPKAPQDPTYRMGVSKRFFGEKWGSTGNGKAIQLLVGEHFEGEMWRS